MIMMLVDRISIYDSIYINLITSKPGSMRLVCGLTVRNQAEAQHDAAICRPLTDDFD